MRRALRRWLVVSAALSAAACFSSAPPAPPVRYFDPSPAPAASRPAPGPAGVVHVAAAAHLGREFAVRVGERELAFDGGNSWVEEPRALVQQLVALHVGDANGRSDAPALAIDVEAFELDVTATPRAHVRLAARWQGTTRVVAATAPASDRSPAAFAAAMATALADVARQLRELLAAAER